MRIRELEELVGTDVKVVVDHSYSRASYRYSEVDKHKGMTYRPRSATIMSRLSWSTRSRRRCGRLADGQ